MTHHEHENEALDARGRIEVALDGVLDRETLDVLLKEVLAVSEQARGWCPNCKKAVQVDIPDSKAVVSAMGELLTQAHGRPGTDDQDDQQTIVNIKHVLGEYHDGEVVEHRNGQHAGLIELPDGSFARRFKNEQNRERRQNSLSRWRVRGVLERVDVSSAGGQRAPLGSPQARRRRREV